MLRQMNQKKTGTECVRGAGAAGFPNHRWLTLPNLLSVIRLALIPVMIWLFVGRENRMAAVAVIAATTAIAVVAAVRVNIPTPLKHIAAHIVESVSVGFLLCYWMCFSSTVTIIPAYFIKFIAS